MLCVCCECVFVFADISESSVEACRGRYGSQRMCLRGSRQPPFGAEFHVADCCSVSPSHPHTLTPLTYHTLTHTGEAQGPLPHFRPQFQHCQLPILGPLFLRVLPSCTHDAPQCLREPPTRRGVHWDHCRLKRNSVSWSLSLHKHTLTHARTHTRTHTCTHAHTHTQEETQRGGPEEGGRQLVYRQPSLLRDP